MFVIYVDIGAFVHLAVFLLNPYIMYVYAQMYFFLEMSQKLLLLS